MIVADGNVFMQGAALKNQNAANLQNQLSDALKIYLERKKGGGGDLVKLAEAAAYKKASGLELSPEEDALAMGWDKIESSKVALDPLGRPYSPRGRLFDEMAAAASQPYSPMYGNAEHRPDMAEQTFPAGFSNGSINDPVDVELPGSPMNVSQLNDLLPEQVQDVDRFGQNINQEGPIQDQDFNNPSVSERLEGKVSPNTPAVLQAEIDAAKQSAVEGEKAKIERTNKQADMTKGKTAFQKVIDEMRSASDALDDAGASVSTGGDVGTNIKNYARSTGPGQIIEGAIGTPAQEARDRYQAARQNLIPALMQATGMSAQQLNSNVELQNFLKALSSPGMSKQARAKILDNMASQYGLGTQEAPQNNVIDYTEYFK